MNYTAWKTTSGPGSEPISTADAKTYLNVSTSLHNDLIDNLVKSARTLYEQYTSTAVITQTVTQVWDCTPYNGFELAVGPVTTATVYYKDANGTYQEWASSNYTFDIISPLARVIRKATIGWPTTGDFPAKWKIEYAAGYASAAAVPEDIISAILLMVGFLYENREDIPISDTSNPKVRSFAAVAFGRKLHLI